MDEPLLKRVEALEIQCSAYSALFNGLVRVLGPSFVDVAAEVTQLVEGDPKTPRMVKERVIEALRIIDQIRVVADRKPKPGNIV